MFHASDDKQYLAMLAIPVLLSIVFAMASDSALNRSLSSRTNDDTKLEDSDSDDVKREGATELTNSGDVTSKKQLLQLAIESHDYTAFLSASAGTPFAEIMTQNAFDVLVNEYQLQKSGYRKSMYMNLDSGDFEV